MLKVICNKYKCDTEWDSEVDEMDKRSFMNFRESSRITIGKSKPQKQRKLLVRKHLSDKIGQNLTVDDPDRNHHKIGSVVIEGVSENSKHYSS